ncbi:hypothetical protein BGS_0449 [Beggiatoa sp. SS]|nr:hypothetical protein BGS_0449 [Beggiatoa sp. SS]
MFFQGHRSNFNWLERQQILKGIKSWSRISKFAGLCEGGIVHHLFLFATGEYSIHHSQSGYQKNGHNQIRSIGGQEIGIPKYI